MVYGELPYQNNDWLIRRDPANCGGAGVSVVVASGSKYLWRCKKGKKDRMAAFVGCGHGLPPVWYVVEENSGRRKM